MSEEMGKSPKTRKQALWENISSLGLAFLVVFMIRSSVIEAFKIPSGSMIPTLLVGDHIFINKFAYGFKLPFTEWMPFLDGPVTLIERDPPTRGDIIVFIYPRDESLYYIKRVVGQPGDVIEMKSKILYVNQKPVPQKDLEGAELDSIRATFSDSKLPTAALRVFREELGDGHLAMIDQSDYRGENFGPITVPADHLFVMGDNRDYSNDSRYWGFVPNKNVKGKAMIVWLSLTLGLGDHPFAFRPSRSGKLLE